MLSILVRYSGKLLISNPETHTDIKLNVSSEVVNIEDFEIKRINLFVALLQIILSNVYIFVV